jgi:hypothetical protein
MLNTKILEFKWTGRNFKLYINKEYAWTGASENMLYADFINFYMPLGVLSPQKYAGLMDNGLVNDKATFAEMREILNALDVEVIQSGAATILIWSE